MTTIEEAFAKGNRELACRISIDGIVYDDHFVENFKVVTGLGENNTFKVGNAFMSTLDLNLVNMDQNFTSEKLANKEGIVELGIKVDGDFKYSQIGIFILDKPTVDNYSWHITGNDRMKKFDVKYIDTLTYPATVGKLYEAICKQVGVVYQAISGDPANINIAIKPNYYEMTCREILSHIAELFSGWFVIDEKGTLKLVTADTIKSTIKLDDSNLIEFKENMNTVNSSLIQIDSYSVIQQGTDPVDSNPAGKYKFYMVDNMFVQGNLNNFIPYVQKASRFNTISSVNVKYNGNPCIGVGNFIKITRSGKDYNVIPYNRVLTYNGGLTEELNCPSINYDPTNRKSQLVRHIQKVNALLKVMDEKIEAKVGNEELQSVIEQTQQAIKAMAKEIDLTGYVKLTDLSNPDSSTSINGSLIKSGKLSSTDGKMFIDLENKTIFLGDDLGNYVLKFENNKLVWGDGSFTSENLSEGLKAELKSPTAISSNVHIAYANSADGKVDFSTADPNRSYIGIYNLLGKYMDGENKNLLTNTNVVVSNNNYSLMTYNWTSTSDIVPGDEYTVLIEGDLGTDGTNTGWYLNIHNGVDSAYPAMITLTSANKVRDGVWIGTFKMPAFTPSDKSLARSILYKYPIKTGGTVATVKAIKIQKGKNIGIEYSMSPTEFMTPPTDPSKYTWSYGKGQDGLVLNNYLKGGKVSVVDNTNYNIVNVQLDQSPQVDEFYTLTLKGKLGSDRTSFNIYNTRGDVVLGVLTYKGNGIYSSTFKWKNLRPDGSEVTPSSVLIYQIAYTGTSASSIEWVTLVKSTVGTNDWIPSQSELKGQSQYLHIRYSDDNSSTGAMFVNATSDTGVAHKFVGTAVTTSSGAPANKTDYTWVKFVGEDGKDGTAGVTGPPGKDGLTPYFHTAWAMNSTGTSGFSTSISSNKLFMGTYTDYIKEDSTDPSKYKWVLIKGADGANGVPGPAGKDGQTTYFHTAWANDPNGVDFSTSISTDKLYMGTYTDFIEADSEDYRKYSWTKIKGDTGQTGAPGPQGPSGKDALLTDLKISNLIKNGNFAGGTRYWDNSDGSKISTNGYTLSNTDDYISQIINLEKNTDYTIMVEYSNSFALEIYEGNNKRYYSSIVGGDTNRVVTFNTLKYEFLFTGLPITLRFTSYKNSVIKTVTMLKGNVQINNYIHNAGELLSDLIEFPESLKNWDSKSVNISGKYVYTPELFVSTNSKVTDSTKTGIYMGNGLSVGSEIVSGLATINNNRIVKLERPDGSGFLGYYKDRQITWDQYGNVNMPKLRADEIEAGAITTDALYPTANGVINLQKGVKPGTQYGMRLQYDTNDVKLMYSDNSFIWVTKDGFKVHRGGQVQFTTSGTYTGCYARDGYFGQVDHSGTGMRADATIGKFYAVVDGTTYLLANNQGAYAFSWGTLSDVRLKENIRKIDGNVTLRKNEENWSEPITKSEILDFIKNSNLYTYNFKEQKVPCFSLITQTVKGKVRDVLIKRVKTDNEAFERETLDVYNYTSMLHLTLQEEIKRNDDLEAKFTKLEKENAEIKERLKKLEDIILKGSN